SEVPEVSPSAFGAGLAYSRTGAAWVTASRIFLARPQNNLEAALGSKWDWQVFMTDTGGGRTYLQWMMSAWGWTLSVALLALIVALVVGSLMGILRTTPNKWFVALGNGWTELFRNIPLLVQIFLWYHVIPTIFMSLRAIPSF